MPGVGHGRADRAGHLGRVRGRDRPAAAGRWAVATALVLGALAIGLLGLNADGHHPDDAFVDTAGLGRRRRRCSPRTSRPVPATRSSSSTTTDPGRGGRRRLGRRDGRRREATPAGTGEPVLIDGDAQRDRRHPPGPRPRRTPARPRRTRSTRRPWSAAHRHPHRHQRRRRRRPQPDRAPGAAGGARRSWSCCCGRSSRRSCSWRPSCCRSRAALGISALLFKHVIRFARRRQSLPLFVFVFLVALGVDYNIFLMTRRPRGSARATAPAGGAAPGWRPPAGSSPPPAWSSRARSPRSPRCR